MKISHFTIQAFLFLLVFLLGSSQVVAQDFVAITDEYSCGRLGDGKLHVVKVTNDGFSVFAKGKVSKAYKKELTLLDRRLGVLADLKKDLLKGRLDGGALKQLFNLFKALANGETPAVDTVEQQLTSVENAQLQFKQRKVNVKLYLKAIDQCEKQKLNGLEALGALVKIVYVPGASGSSAGFLISIPSPAAKTFSVVACLQYTDGATPVGEPIQTIRASVTFAKDLCVYGPVLLDRPFDCKTQVPSGLLSFYLPKYRFSFDYGLQSTQVQGALATLADQSGIYKFRVVPVNAAPGKDCKRI